MLGSAPTLRAVLALSLVTVGLGVAAPAVGAQGPALDTVSVTGSAGDMRNIYVTAQAEPSGANASGTASFGLLVTEPPIGLITFAGPVTCLSVTGPDLGAGRPGAPTVAILTFVDTDVVSQLGAFTIEVVDNGGGGADRFGISAFRDPSDCSPPASPGPFTNGRAVVYDAPLVPMSKADCKHGGWRDF